MPAFFAASALAVPDGSTSESYGAVTVQAATISSIRETMLIHTSRPTTTAKMP